MLPKLDDTAQNVVRFGSALEGKSHEGCCVGDREKNQGCDDEGQGSVDGVSDLFVEVGPAATAVERLLVGEGGGSLRESALLAADYTDCGALRLAAVICVFARRQSWGL